MTTQLPRLKGNISYVDAKGKPTTILQQQWDQLAGQVEAQFSTINVTLADIQDLVTFHQHFDDAIAPLIILIESRVSAIEARLLAAGIP